MKLTFTENEIKQLLMYIKSNKGEEGLFNKILYQLEIEKKKDISMKQSIIKNIR